MTTLLTPTIQTLTLPNADTRYILPPRQLGLTRFLGFVPILFGTFFGGFAVFWMIQASGFLVGKGGPQPQFFNLIFMLWGIPFVLVGLFIIRAGMIVILAKNAEAIVSPTTITIINIATPFRQTWRLPRNSIARIRVGYPPITTRRGGQTTPTPALALIFDRHSGAPVLTLTGYPQALLTELASLLAASSDPAALLRPTTALANTIPITIDNAPPASSQLPGSPATYDTELSIQPANSKILLNRTGDSLTLQIPPTGFRKAAGFTLLFGIFWIFLSSFITFAMIHQAGQQNLPNLIGPLLFGLLFEAIGVTFVAVATQLARRKSVIIATPTDLVFAQSGPLRKSERSWTRDQIKSIVVGDSSTEINDVPLKQLQIRQTNGKSKGILTGRDEPELLWLATELRAAIALTI